MKKVYIIRHGESKENVDKIFSAGKSPLTDQGVKQAEKLAERFENIKLDSIFTSHYKRAEQTAQIVAKIKSMSYKVLDFTHEHAYLGDEYAGKHKNDAELKKIKEAVIESWLKDETSDKLSNESYSELMSRVDKFIAFINTRTEADILLVTHTMFIYALLARVYFKDKLTPSIVYMLREHSKLTNTGISIFLIDNNANWKVKTFNDDLHV